MKRLGQERYDLLRWQSMKGPKVDREAVRFVLVLQLKELDTKEKEFE